MDREPERRRTKPGASLGTRAAKCPAPPAARAAKPSLAKPVLGTCAADWLHDSAPCCPRTRPQLWRLWANGSRKRLLCLLNCARVVQKGMRAAPIRSPLSGGWHRGSLAYLGHHLRVVRKGRGRRTPLPLCCESAPKASVRRTSMPASAAQWSSDQPCKMCAGCRIVLAGALRAAYERVEDSDCFPCCMVPVCSVPPVAGVV